MQNTDTTTPTGTASSIAEPRLSTAPVLKITINHEPDAHHAETHKPGFLRRALMLCAKILPHRRKRLKQDALVTAAAPLQQTSVTLQEKHPETIAPLTPQPHIPATPHPPASGNAYLRKMAEQQFWEMDVTQAPRN